MDKSTILLLGKLPPPYMGPAIATKILLNSSLREKFNLIHFDTRLNQDISTLGKFQWNKLFSVRLQLQQFKKSLAENKPEIVHIPISQTSMGFWKDARFIQAAKKSGARVLLHLRGSAFRTWYNSTSKFHQKAIRKVLNLSDGVIVLGECLKYLFFRIIPMEKIFVVPNGGDFSFPERTSSSQTVKILYLSNFLPGKGFLELLKALAILKEKVPDGWRLKAAGSWDNKGYKTQCLDFISEKGLEDFIEILPPAYDAKKWQLYSDADLFAFVPQHQEGHPWAIIEAAAAGLPAIATDRGAIRESVLHGKSGFVLQPSDIEGMADGFMRLIKDKPLRNQMSEIARKHYENNFTEEKMVMKLEKVYENLLQSKTNKSR